MKINFRTAILAPAVLAVASFAAVSAQAEATFKVPFAFQAEGKSLPAGYYTVSKDTRSNLVTLRSKADGRSMSWVAGPGDGAATATEKTMRFAVKGSQRELRSVQYGAVTTSRLDKAKHGERVPVETVVGQ